MKTIWIHGLEGDRKEDIISSFKASTLFRGRLEEILESKMDTEIIARTGKTDYESPNWAYRQADSSGYIRALREIISLIHDK